jgi:hypothetical protein
MPSSETVRTTLITVIGTIVVALVTTLGTLYSNIVGSQDKIGKIQADVGAFKLPVGSVVGSLLTPAEFAQQVGDPGNFDVTKSRWTLADGKSVSGTGWAKLRENAPVPNLCGVFLRGKNNASRSATEVPELNLGQYDADLVGPHEHDIMVQRNGGPTGGGILWFGSNHGAVVLDPLVEGVHYDGNARTPYETRPKNVTVNFFVKIND